MKNFTSADFADPDNPTPEEWKLWLCIEPTRGIRMIEGNLEEFAEGKAAMDAATRRSEKERLRKQGDSIARIMLNFLYDVLEIVPTDPRIFKNESESQLKRIHTAFSLIGLSRKYLPHVSMPDRGEWRILLRQVESLCKDWVGLHTASVTGKPLSPALRRRQAQLEKETDDGTRTKPRKRRRKGGKG